MKIDEIKDIKRNLERYFNSVINTAKSDKEFFILLADYWAYLVRNDEVIGKAANDIIDSNRKATELLKKLENGAAKAIETAYEKVLKSIEKNKIESPEIKELQDEFEGYRTGRILSSAQLSDSYQRILTRLIMHLRDSGHKDLVKNHFVEGDDGHIREFLLPKEFVEKTKKSFELEDTEKKGLWKAWNNLIILYLAYFEGYKHAEEIEKDPKRSWEAMNFRGIVGELETILNDKKSGDNFVVFFKREDFRLYITRIHNYLISHLNITDPGDFEEKKNQITAENVLEKTHSFSQDNITITLKSGVLKINKNIGNVMLNNTNTMFNPGGKEFKTLLKLVESQDYKATYNELLLEDKGSKRRELAFTIRNIKKNLGILPEENRKNDDIIQNIKNHGYRLIV